MAKNISPAHIWHQIIKKFNQSQLEYVLVGGAALIIHGLPRSTLDMDFYLISRKNTIERIFEIMDSLKLVSQQKDILKLLNFPHLLEGQWISFAHEKKDIVDVYLASEKEFQPLYKNSELKNDNDIHIRVASLNDLKAMKRISARAIDLADIKLIEESKKYKK